MSEQIYKRIGDIAMNSKKPIKISELAILLGIQNTGRNIHNYIRGAYGYFTRAGKATIAGRISGVYVNENGGYVYQENN